MRKASLPSCQAHAWIVINARCLYRKYTTGASVSWTAAEPVFYL